MCDAIYIGNTNQTSKKMDGYLSDVPYVFSKTDKNMTHSLPMMNSALNILIHAHNYVSEQYSK